MIRENRTILSVPPHAHHLDLLLVELLPGGGSQDLLEPPCVDAVVLLNKALNTQNNRHIQPDM